MWNFNFSSIEGNAFIFSFSHYQFYSRSHFHSNFRTQFPSCSILLLLTSVLSTCQFLFYSTLLSLTQSLFVPTSLHSDSSPPSHSPSLPNSNTRYRICYLLSSSDVCLGALYVLIILNFRITVLTYFPYFRITSFVMLPIFEKL